MIQWLVAAMLVTASVAPAVASDPEPPAGPPEDASIQLPSPPFPPSPPPQIVLPPKPHPPIARGERATRIHVDKAWRVMMIETNRKVRRVYAIGLGDDPIGHKQQRGDSRTPEGRYAISFKNDRSKFHLSLRVSYPNDRDRANARKLKVHPGSDIMIHGRPNGVEWWRTMLMDRDWTDGCIAVTNDEIEEIWKLVSVGTRIDIRP
jgi:murein L,D-transpeptidase YafK